MRVLRCKKGSAIVVFNGQGGEYTGTLLNDDPRSAVIDIGKFIETSRESPLRITLLQGISRSEHMDTTIQKATELGVAEIIPVITERSMAMQHERARKKHARWQQIAISACEQSGRNVLPALNEASELRSAIGQAAAGCKLVLDPAADASLHNIDFDGAAVCVLCGPEGGLSEQEIMLAAAAGYSKIKMGPRILRTETAGPAMISALQALWGDMG